MCMGLAIAFTLFLSPTNFYGSASFLRKDYGVVTAGWDQKIDWPPESPDNQYHLNK